MHLRSLHWTGHYIPDPTLALATGMNHQYYRVSHQQLTFGCPAHSWDTGVYQALTFAKTFGRKARLPSIPRMWKEYPGAGKELEPLFVKGEGA